MSSSYQEIIDRVHGLSIVEQQRLLEYLESRANTSRPTHSIMELQGLGKEVWRGVDAQEYINQERDSWHG